MNFTKLLADLDELQSSEQVPSNLLNECSCGTSPSEPVDSFSVSTNYDSVNNHKSITVNASGEKAEEIARLLQLSGVDPKQEVLADDNSVTTSCQVAEGSEYVIVVDGKYLMTRASDDKPMFSDNIKDAAKYKTSGAANGEAVQIKDQTGKNPQVKPVLEYRQENRIFANAPNEQIAGWRAVIDNADGPNNPKDMHSKYKGDNPLTIDKKEEKLHPDQKINEMATTLLNKFHRALKENADTVYNAIMGRLERTNHNVIEKFGLDMVEAIAREVADEIGPVDGISGKELSLWVRTVNAKLRDSQQSEETPFNYCTDCEGSGVDEEGNLCYSCEGTGKYAVGANHDHYL